MSKKTLTWERIVAYPLVASLLAGAGFFYSHPRMKEKVMETFGIGASEKVEAETQISNANISKLTELLQEVKSRKERRLEDKVEEEKDVKPKQRKRDEVSENYKILEDFIGKPYGPKYPTGDVKGKEMYDCVGLIYAYAERRGIKLTGSRGDQVYARHTNPIIILKPGKYDLEGIKSGDLVFIGHPYTKGEGNISAYHLGVVGKVERNEQGKPIDATMVHASGRYSKNRKNYEGKVKEVNLIDYLKRFEDNSRRNHMFIGRLK